MPATSSLWAKPGDALPFRNVQRAVLRQTFGLSVWVKREAAAQELRRHDNVEPPWRRRPPVFPRSQVNDHAAASLRITDAVEHPVACVERLTIDVHLRDQTPLPGHMHGKVNVRRPPRIGTGRMVRNRYCPFRPLGCGHSPGRHGRCAPARLRVGDDRCHSHRIARSPPCCRASAVRGYPAPAPRLDHLSQGLGGPTCDPHQVIVHVGWELDRVERTLRLPRRRSELGCNQAIRG